MASHKPSEVSGQWSALSDTNIAVEKLYLLSHSFKELRRSGYVLTQLDEKTLWGKMRCRNCTARMRYYQPLLYNSRQNTDSNSHLSADAGGSTETNQNVTNAMACAKNQLRRRHLCMFHDGKVVRGFWSCCQGRPQTRGCCSNLYHEPSHEDDMMAYWTFHETPAVQVKKIDKPEPKIGHRKHYRPLRYMNGSAPPRDIRTAVVLDCEMGVAVNGNSELIRLTMVDFFTRQILINHLVKPTVEMKHYNTRYSGVTASSMYRAMRERTCIFGRDAARERVFHFVGPDTIVVLHGGNSDLTALRWIHPTVVDTCILELYDPWTVKGRSLKELSKKKLGLNIQDAQDVNGRAKGHDSVEDAFATRELAIWWLRIIPNG